MNRTDREISKTIELNYLVNKNDPNYVYLQYFKNNNQLAKCNKIKIKIIINNNRKKKIFWFT